MEANYDFFNSSLTSPTCAFPHVYYYLFSVGLYVLGRLTGPRELNDSQWQRMRWLDGITNSMDMNLGKPQEILEGREAWHTAVHGITISQTQLSNWTTSSIFGFCSYCFIGLFLNDCVVAFSLKSRIIPGCQISLFLFNKCTKIGNVLRCKKKKKWTPKYSKENNPDICHWCNQYLKT